MGLYTLMKFVRFALFSAPSASWASVFGVNLHNYGRVVWPAIYTCSCTQKKRISPAIMAFPVLTSAIEYATVIKQNWFVTAPCHIFRRQFLFHARPGCFGRLPSRNRDGNGVRRGRTGAPYERTYENVCRHDINSCWTLCGNSAAGSKQTRTLGRELGVGVVVLGVAYIALQ